MNVLLSLLLILGSSLVLVKAVKWFINATTTISKELKISGYTISFLLVSIATSLPEIVVGITSAVEDKAILSYGNALGSNIALLTLVIAFACFMGKGIKTERIFRSKDIYFSSLFSLMAVALALDKRISTTTGILLVLVYVIYSLAFLRSSTPLERISEKLDEVNLWKQGVVFIASLGLLIISSEGIVKGAVNLSELLNLQLGFIGLSITALGTSLPEIAYSIAALKVDEEEEILGDIIGSVSANSTIVLGITAIIRPIEITNGGISIFTYAFAVLTTLLFFGFCKTKENLSKLESITLLFVYIGFLVAQFLIQ